MPEVTSETTKLPENYEAQLAVLRQLRDEGRVKASDNLDPILDSNLFHEGTFKGDEPNTEARFRFRPPFIDKNTQLLRRNGDLSAYNELVGLLKAADPNISIETGIMNLVEDEYQTGRVAKLLKRFGLRR
jgi:hypothetical protein